MRSHCAHDGSCAPPGVSLSWLSKPPCSISSCAGLELGVKQQRCCDLQKQGDGSTVWWLSPACLRLLYLLIRIRKSFWRGLWKNILAPACSSGTCCPALSCCCSHCLRWGEESMLYVKQDPSPACRNDKYLRSLCHLRP